MPILAVNIVILVKYSLPAAM